MSLNHTEHIPIRLATALLGALIIPLNVAAGQTSTPKQDNLTATKPDEVLHLIDLSRPGLEHVRAAVSRRDEDDAWDELVVPEKV